MRAGRHVGELVLLGLDAADGDHTGVDQDAVLVGRLDVEVELGAGGEQSSAPSSGVAVATGEVSPSSDPRNTRASQPAPVTGSGA